MTLTYFGHSAFQLVVDGTTVLVDPFLGDNPHTDRSPDDVHPDVILLTHAHGDHWGDTAAIARRTGALVVANYEITQYLTARHGHENVHGMNTGGSWTFPWGRVTMTWALHSSSFPDGTYGGNPGGFMIEAGGLCVYAAGDTSPFHEMVWLGTDFDIDYALLPIGDCFTMGIPGSRRAADMLNPRITIPVHYNTFPPIEVDLAAWEREFSEAGHDTRVMAPDTSMDLRGA
ncbi:MAG: metal-dependent hydrolase [Rhodothermales bacterium]